MILHNEDNLRSKLEKAQEVNVLLNDLEMQEYAVFETLTRLSEVGIPIFSLLATEYELDFVELRKKLINRDFLADNVRDIVKQYINRSER